MSDTERSAARSAWKVVDQLKAQTAELERRLARTAAERDDARRAASQAEGVIRRTTKQIVQLRKMLYGTGMVRKAR